MEDHLIDGEDLSLGRKSVLPGEGFFYPDSLDDSRADRRAATALTGASTAVIADPDADGLACVAMVREAYGRPLSALPEPPEARIRGRLGVDEDDGVDEDPEDGKADGDGTGDAADRTAPDADADAATPDGEDPDLAGGGGDADGEDPGLDAGDDGPVPAAGDDRDTDPVRATSDVALVPAGPTEIGEAFERVLAHADPGIDVFVCDLCPDEFGAVEAELTALVDLAGAVRWFDHHQWDPDVAAAVRSAGVDLVVGESDEECTADVALRSIDHDFPDRFADLAAVTRDHDLWIREDPRSDDLADYAYWIDSETYVGTVRAHGPDLPEVVEAYLAERRREKEALIDRAVARADRRQVGPWDVGVTYGRCSQNEVAERLREEGADAAVVVKPAGSASIRGSETFELAHEVARRVNGGGHPRAAGCKPDVYEDMLDYAHHWTTRGAVAKRAILDAFEAVAAERAGGSEAGEATAGADPDDGE